ncbi:hypothetical protein RJ639_009021 [Escallonia herrerae]|uniref:Peptidase C1A papain C-terminal domain-containing protein n=1 Tax=Escallonia herrerae TaxID=1293975 RepID=A0AA88VT53_9ASTE|nr:hypothetical protein RJ639_009021 [Escallonia herrerae]
MAEALGFQRHQHTSRLAVEREDMVGSCWAFAAVGAMEGINQLITDIHDERFMEKEAKKLVMITHSTKFEKRKAHCKKLLLASKDNTINS